MIKAETCPTREELIQFNLDVLPGDLVEAVCDHVEICPRCQQVFEQLEESTNAFGEQLAGISEGELEQARLAIELETFQETATSIWGAFSKVVESSTQKPTLSVPCTLRQYEVLRLIGHGGMGEVYEGRHTNLKRPVALKVIRGIRQNDPLTYEHFLREMETAGQLEHPNLVRAYDAWEHEGCLFLAQELLDGESLQHLGTEGSIGTATEIIEIMLGTCMALGQLHSKGFVHRDVKPGNIMRLKDGTIKLIDYGLAIAVESGKSASRVGAGTVGYMSPEQAHGDHPIDHRSDLYSAGRVLKYLMSKLPAESKVRSLNNIFLSLEALAEKLTETEPSHRLQTAQAVIDSLEALSSCSSGMESKLEELALTPQLGGQRYPRSTSEKDSLVDDQAVHASSMRGRYIASILLTLVLVGLIGWVAFQFTFKTDQRSIVVIENYRTDDSVEIVSEDGEVRSIELGETSSFILDPGSYQLSLVNAEGRELNPSSIELTGQDQITLRVADRPPAFAEIDRDPGGNANRPELQPWIERARPEGRPAGLSAPFSVDEIQAARLAWSEYLGLPEVIRVGTIQDPDFQMDFILIPPGVYEMGWPNGLPLLRGNRPETAEASRPARRIKISRPFYLGCYEVTTSQFDSVMDGLRIGSIKTGQLPITQVTWQESVDFCQRLSQTATEIYQGFAFRLPTEAEWEYACRAGTTTRFWTGDTLEATEASLRIQGREMRLEAVNHFPPNPFGLYNMHGNVAEWCTDWFDPDFYRQSPGEDPAGPGVGAQKVIRGGGFTNPPFACTSFWRQSYRPETRGESIGFRPVLQLPTAL